MTTNDECAFQPRRHTFACVYLTFDEDGWKSYLLHRGRGGLISLASHQPCQTRHTPNQHRIRTMRDVKSMRPHLVHSRWCTRREIHMYMSRFVDLPRCEEYDLYQYPLASCRFFHRYERGKNGDTTIHDDKRPIASMAEPTATISNHRPAHTQPYRINSNRPITLITDRCVIKANYWNNPQHIRLSTTDFCQSVGVVRFEF